MSSSAFTLNLNTIAQLYADQAQSAKLAHLKYLEGEVLGIHRVKKGKGFAYVDSKGKSLSDARLREWIDGLVIPPAWQEVWISPFKNSHLLVTGLDDKQRKQYMYHPRWRQIRDLLNFSHIILFGKDLPTLRKKIDSDLRQRKLNQSKVIALVLRLVDRTYIRIGSEEYAKENESYGLTTLRDEHVSIEDDQVIFNFRGKSGKDHEITIEDPQLAKIIEECKDLQGDTLFSYTAETGTAAVSASEVNNYLREITQHDFSAKNFRTWGGTLTAYESLRIELKSRAAEAEPIKKVLIEAIDKTAEALGNTRAVSRAHYIHPYLMSSFEAGTLGDFLAKIPPQRSDEYLSKTERELIQLMGLFLEEEFGKMTKVLATLEFEKE